MTAPVAVARTDPRTVGSPIWVPDGYRAKYTFGNVPTLALFEVSLTPAGFDMGEPIPQDHMWIDRWRIVRERKIITFTPATVKFMYDPAFKSLLNGIVGVNQTCSEYLYDGSSTAYFGIPKSFIFDEHVEGQPGTGTATIVPSNWDPSGKVEAGPVFVSVSGS